ncbi:MAG: WXG100 family type VII secretion target [Bifidobacteriaceae bacterium]|jgi:uncharacterized protein YukE|nr:WXG100 family type VII secretion target [Bifidobacteriaceae bacterium]
MSGATQCLTPPPQTRLYLEKNITSQFSGMLSVLDKVAELILGYSPLEELVYKPFFGDWDALIAAATAWRNSATAVSVVAADLTALEEVLGDGWAGRGADAFREQLEEYIEGLQEYPDAARQMAEMLDASVEAGAAAAEAVAAAINLMVEVGMILLTELAVPVAGWVAGGATVALYGPRVMWAASNAVRAVNTVIRVIQLIHDAIGILNAAIAAIQAIVKVIETSGNLSREASEAITAADGLSSW